MNTVKLFVGAMLVGLVVGGSAHAQSASLLAPTAPRAVYSDQELSLIRVPEPIPLREHDTVNILVNERTLQQANARANRRRQTQYELTFDDLIVLLSGLRIRADEAIRQQTPGFDITAVNNLQTTSQFTRNDALRFSIQATVTEVKPNGTLTIEANGTVGVNNELTTYKLGGVIDSRDVDMRTRTIGSSFIASKRIELVQVGPTRDSIKRGWFVRFIDMFSLF